MTNTLNTNVSIRLTDGEKAALGELAKKRGADMAARGEVPDDSVNGYIRAIIRRDALAAGFAVDAPAAPPAKASKKPRK